LQPEINHLPFLFVQRRQQVLELVGKFGTFRWRGSRGDRLKTKRAAGLRIGSQWLFSAKTAFLSQVKASLFPNLGQRDGTQQAPQFFRVTELKLAILGAAEKRTASRLHHILRSQAAAQAKRQVLFRHPLQPLTVVIAEFSDNTRIAIPEPLNQPLPFFIPADHGQLLSKLREGALRRALCSS
jgi:hypothetical protein